MCFGRAVSQNHDSCRNLEILCLQAGQALPVPQVAALGTVTA